MKVLFMLNGLTHYFNLITSKINEHPDIEVIYVFPKSKSSALGAGVFETREGVNFRLIELEEKADESGNLYFEELLDVLKTEMPKVIMLGETHLFLLLKNEEIKKFIKKHSIKLSLKSIPFRMNSLKEEYTLFQRRLNERPVPEFKSLPKIFRVIALKLRLNFLYKKLFLDRKLIKEFKQTIQVRRMAFNAVDGHLNYIEKGKEIYGSYGVPAEKIFVTYNSPDTDTYFTVKEKISKEPPILEPNTYRIIHLSRLVEWKRVDMLIRAVANLKSKYPNIELLIIGNGPEEIRLKKMAEDLKVSDSIKFLGGIYEAELFGKYIMSASVYVLAGMGGLSINDAMIFGLPVICSVCDGTEKYLVREGYNGLFFEEGNQQNLESKIAYLFNHPEIRIAMGKNSEKIIKEEINIDTVVNRYVHAFKTIASS